MFRLTGSALALLAAFSLVPIASVEAGSREGHRTVKHKTYKLKVRHAGNRDRHRLRVVNKNVVVVKLDGGKRRHKGFHSYGTYSGDVDISVRAGVGQWTYGTSNSLAVTEAAAPMVKIIDVGRLKANDACVMEAGVCVIRP
jgi:hypothetical protein